MVKNTKKKNRIAFKKLHYLSFFTRAFSFHKTNPTQIVAINQGVNTLDLIKQGFVKTLKSIPCCLIATTHSLIGIHLTSPLLP